MEKNIEVFFKLLHSEGKLKSSQKLALAIIMDYQNLKDNGSWNNTPLSKLSKEVGVTERNTQYVLKDLEKMGLIAKKANAHKRANDYIPNIEAISNLIGEDENNTAKLNTSTNTAKTESCENNNNWDIMSIGEARKLWNNNNN